MNPKINKMIKEDNNKSFDWVYYVIGLFFGLLTGAVISGTFGGAVLGAVIGFVFSILFLNKIVKGRVY